MELNIEGNIHLLLPSRLWSFFELYMLYVAILGGLLSSVSRIFLLICLNLVGFARID